jgi:hypothetical protein
MHTSCPSALIMGLPESLPRETGSGHESETAGLEKRFIPVMNFQLALCYLWQK